MKRRRFLALCAIAGLGQTLFPEALLSLMQPAAKSGSAKVSHGDLLASLPDVPGEDATEFPKITPEMIEAAAAIAGINLSDAQKKVMVEGLTGQRESIAVIRKLHLPNSVAPAFNFDPVPAGVALETARRPVQLSAAPKLSQLDAAAATLGHGSAAAGQSTEDQLAFATLRDLAELLRTRKLSSTDLTKLYLGRLKKYDPQLHFVITYTGQRALDQAAAADREIAAGKHRGPLHGVPWGAKDLLAVKGYPTTWGAAGFEKQSFDEDATVVQRLDAAGAVLLAKLTLGALAQGDLWFGGRTRNPWNPRQGSSGSSAGVASTVAAGCVGFGIGTETLGSISSPSTRCGATGLRPSFGLVPRTGAMALSWSMDKIGPICRAVEDCAIVLSAIYGPDGHDRSVQQAAFNWNADLDWKQLRVGYLKAAFDKPSPPVARKPPETMKGKELEDYKARTKRQAGFFERRVYDSRFDAATLDVLRRMGVNLIPVELPKLPYGEMVPVLEAEGAAAFDELTRSGRDHLLNGQEPYDWPNSFRVARLYPAVDYVQAMRARSLAIEAMHRMFTGIDVIVTPTGGQQLVATNLTGIPAVILPNGLRGPDAPPPLHDVDGAVDNTGGPGTPVSITFLGQLYGEAKLLAFARAYQQAAGFEHLHPKLA